MLKKLLWKEGDMLSILILNSKIYIPSPGINIDTSENAAFTAEKLNAAKSYASITDC